MIESDLALICHNHPFACGQPIVFDHIRSAERIQGRRYLGFIGAGKTSGGRNPGVVHELLGKIFRSLESGCDCAGAKGGNSGAAQIICQAVNQRFLGAYHD